MPGQAWTTLYRRGVGSEQPRHSQAALQWIDYEAKKHNYPRVQHAGNGPEVPLGQRHIPVDGYNGESGTVFQYYGCLFHGHDCGLATKSGDTWLGTEASDRRLSTEEIERYLEQTCGYTVVTIWECQWQALKRQDPEAAKQVAANPAITLEPSRLPVPESHTAWVLQAIKEGEIFGLALMDIHTPAHLRDKFRDLPPIFKTCEVSRDDVGEHMRAFCEPTGSLARPRRMLISSYFAVKTLIPTPLQRWYLQQGLEVTRPDLLMQYQPDILNTVPVTYRIIDVSGEDVSGNFYGPELQKITPPEYFDVEAVLDTRRKHGRTEYLVKWANYPASFNSWETDLITPVA